MRGRVYKVSSLASGEVSVVFHVEEASADAALALRRTRGQAVMLAVEVIGGP